MVLGAILAHHQGATLKPGLFLLTLAAALMIQAATNLLNDAEDARSGNDGPDRLGPQRLTGAGLATPGTMRRSAMWLFGSALVMGLGLVWAGGWPILALGLASLLAGWAYSGGPIPLSHTPFGEVFVVGFFGVAAVVGTNYLQAGHASSEAAWMGLAIGLHASAVLIMNNIRDRQADEEAGRQTLAILLGQERALHIYRLLLMLPFLIMGLSLGARNVGLAWGALPFCAWLAWRVAEQTSGPSMNRQMALTALSQVLLGGLLALNLLWVTA